MEDLSPSSFFSSLPSVNLLEDPFVLSRVSTKEIVPVEISGVNDAWEGGLIGGGPLSSLVGEDISESIGVIHGDGVSRAEPWVYEVGHVAAGEISRGQEHFAS